MQEHGTARPDAEFEIPAEQRPHAQTAPWLTSTTDTQPIGSERIEHRFCCEFTLGCFIDRCAYLSTHMVNLRRIALAAVVYGPLRAADSGRSTERALRIRADLQPQPVHGRHLDGCPNNPKVEGERRIEHTDT